MFLLWRGAAGRGLPLFFDGVGASLPLSSPFEAVFDFSILVRLQMFIGR